MKILQVIAIAGVMVGPAFAQAEEADQLVPSVQEQSIIAAEQVGASMTPAEKHHKRIENERMREGDTEASPRMKAKQNTMKFPTEHHRNAYHSLSEKNQHAYDGLEDHEQDHVAEAYRNGSNHQRTMSSILKKDQKQHNKATKYNDDAMEETTFRHDKGMGDSPASHAMKKQQQKKDKKKHDIFG